MTPRNPRYRTPLSRGTAAAPLALASLVLAVLATALVGCSDDADSGAATTSSSSTATEDSTSSSTTTPPAGNPSTGCRQSPVDDNDPGPENQSRVDDNDPRPDDRSGSAATVMEAVDEAGRTRSYLFAMPDNAAPNQPMPMVLALHGALGSAAQFDESTDLVDRGTERGFAVIAPDAIDGSWDYGVEGPDHAFLVDLIDTTTSDHCIDLDRIHLVGMSLGAWKGAVTACAAPATFASAVLVTVEVRPEGCQPLPVLAIHGTADRIAPYGDGGDDIEVDGPLAGLSGTRENVAGWAEGAGCEPVWEETRIEPDVIHWIYQGCGAGLGVELFTVEGGDHSWPGSATDPLPTTTAIDATDLALDWFDQHTLTTGSG